MKLSEDEELVNYLEHRRYLMLKLQQEQPIGLPVDGKTFSIDSPHTCRHCQKIVLDGEVCKEIWQNPTGRRMGDPDACCESTSICVTERYIVRSCPWLLTSGSHSKLKSQLRPEHACGDP